MPHIPPLLGGPKSVQFLIKPLEATPDTPPDPDARIDLHRVEVSSTGLRAFADFFERVEDQADQQYSAALMETQQRLAEAAAANQQVEVLFTPDTVNSTATGYFRRLERLAQDTGTPIVLPIVDFEDGGVYPSFKEFRPIRTPDVDAYWEGRAPSYAVRTHEVEPPSSSDEALIALRYMALPTGEDYERINQEVYWLRDDLRTVALAPTAVVRELLSEGGDGHDKLPLIRTLALDENSPVSHYQVRGQARLVMAKIGDPELVQTIMREERDKTGGYGSETEMIKPLGIMMRDDPALLAETLDRVQTNIASGKREHETLTLLGALYHSHDPRLAEVFARHLTHIPDHHRAEYGFAVLFAATRWLPMYTARLRETSYTPQQNDSLVTIHNSTIAFLEDYMDGLLDDVRRRMTYGPEYLADILFQFGGPDSERTLRRLVLKQFADGGSVLTDQAFERAYLQYRKLYGDLDEISQHFRPNAE